MAAWTVGFGLLVSAANDTGGRPSHVLRVSDSLKMIGIYTASVSAYVINFQASRDRPDERLVGYHVSVFTLSLIVKARVSIDAMASFPQPAITGNRRTRVRPHEIYPFDERFEFLLIHE
jgi:hypothetical protein